MPKSARPLLTCAHAAFAGTVLLLAACRTWEPPDGMPQAPECCSNPSSRHEDAARAWAAAARRVAGARAARRWLYCATEAYESIRGERSRSVAVPGLATECTERFLTYALSDGGLWKEGPRHVAGTEITVAFRELSPYLQSPLSIDLAHDVPMRLYRGRRYSASGFGAPVALLSKRCDDDPLCSLLPPEGVFRGATAWVETSAHGTPVLVFGDPLRTPVVAIGSQRFPLAIDTSAPWARGAETSKLHRLGIWGLFGGNEVGRRAGVYLLEDYDPNKRPLIMIHGLGSSPLMWAGVSNAVWADPVLRTRYQIWHVVYQTNAPMLVVRRRVQAYLDRAWQILDPEGDDRARHNIVLVGHSLGGVVARVLTADSGGVLWDAAFLSPSAAMRGDPTDLKVVDETFHFSSYPGVRRAIFFAAPHRGTPTVKRWFGRLARVLVGRRSPEIDSLRRVAEANLEAVRPELRGLYLRGWVNSISTLQEAQPVRAAAERLLPRAGTPYHTIAGALPRYGLQSDGAVPLSSTQLDGAESTYVLRHGHDLHENPEAIAEILRILRNDAAQAEPISGY